MNGRGKVRVLGMNLEGRMRKKRMKSERLEQKRKVEEDCRRAKEEPGKCERKA